MDHKQAHEFARMKQIMGEGKWYDWQSPIGLSIFFLAITLIAVIILKIII